MVGTYHSAPRDPGAALAVSFATGAGSTAGEVIDWPHRFLAGTDVDARTVICVLTHDPKFDVRCSR